MGPIRLFKAAVRFLRAEKKGEDEGKDRKFVVISSTVGSIGLQGDMNFPLAAYGISKAGVNWWAKKVSVEFGGGIGGGERRREEGRGG